jgi:indoleacetate---CoA ligase
MMDISGWIERHAGFSPDKCAIRFSGQDLSYREFADRISQFAGVLAKRLGVVQGDRVAYLGLNHPDQIVLLFACARLGAITLPMNWRLEESEYLALLMDSTPVAMFVDAKFAPQGARTASAKGLAVICFDNNEAGLPIMPELIAGASPLPPDRREGAPDDPVLICYTSGSTGRPKGVVLDQNALFVNAVNAAHMHGMTSTDVALNTLPLFHVGGLNVLSLPALHAGATLVMHPVFDVASSFDAIEAGATLAVFVPTQILALMNDPRWQGADFSTLRMISTGSSMIPQRLIRQVHARGVPLIQVYGATETAPIAAYLTQDLAHANAGSAGKPALHCQIRVVDAAGRDLAPGRTGEILIRGGNLMRGYWQNPEATRMAIRDGWFHSGDLGHFDENGCLFVDDRKKDMIISGGENIYPAEIENVLAECPGIVECAVVGQPDSKWGEIAVAFVVSSAGAEAAQICGFLQGRLARYKHPRRVEFMASLPRNAMGKLVKNDLRKLLDIRGEKP